MANIFSFNSYAKTSFTKSQPLGIMSTAVKTDIVVTWEPVKEADGYQIYEQLEGETGGYRVVKQTKSCKAVLHDRLPGQEYRYYVRAYQESSSGERICGKSSKKVSTTVPLTGTSTVKNFLQTAIAPVGSTMYVWGGGWNKADTAAGKDAKTTGLSPAWRSFASNKTASYNYRNYRYQIHDGLDCSGYVGWCIYNVLNTQNNKKGYVYSASKQAEKFADLGFGSYCTANRIRDYKAGDVMSSTCKCCGHVWIVIGQCGDGSVVLVHSSPAGVQLSGTTTGSGKKNSEAYQLAKKYMKKYYKTWYTKYPDVSRGTSYLSHYGQMRWDVTGENVVLSDPDGYQNMSAEEVLKDLFGE
ncbi:MAG: hypothetical protein ACI4A3_07595 [Lachnospiraceae bacterium]